MQFDYPLFPSVLPFLTVCKRCHLSLLLNPLLSIRPYSTATTDECASSVTATDMSQLLLDIASKTVAGCNCQVDRCCQRLAQLHYQPLRMLHSNRAVLYQDLNQLALTAAPDLPTLNRQRCIALVAGQCKPSSGRMQSPNTQMLSMPAQQHHQPLLQCCIPTGLQPTRA